MFRYGFHHGPGVFGWLFLAFLIVAVVIGVIALVRMWSWRGTSFASPRPGPPPAGPWTDPALTELRTRYPRGDISFDEYVEHAGRLGFPIPPGTSPGQ